MLNRSAITIKAKQPFLDWLKGLPDPVDPSMTLEDLNEDRTIYLTPERVDGYDDEPYAHLLPLTFEYIFETRLEAWWRDRKDWPAFEKMGDLFEDWFDVELHSMVLDANDEPIKDKGPRLGARDWFRLQLIRLFRRGYR